MLLSSASGPRLHGRLSSNVRPRKRNFWARMLLLLSGVIVLLALIYALTHGLKPKVKLTVRALLAR